MATNLRQQVLHDHETQRFKMAIYSGERRDELQVDDETRG
jgi:hypothetical protein